MVGRELSGMGGGASGGAIVLLFPAPKPDSRADLARLIFAGGGNRRVGRAGDGSSGTAGWAALDPGLDGSRGGNEGREDGCGGSAMRRGGREGESPAAAASIALASSSRRVGGKGGSLACSRVGGSRLGTCPSGVPLEAADLVWLNDRLDIVDNWDTSEAFEFLLTERVWVEGLRVGSLGVVDSGFRVGSGGGPGRAPGEEAVVESPSSCPVVRRGSGGGSLSVEDRTGLGGSDGLFAGGPSVKERPGGGGGGGLLPAVDGTEGFDWKFFC